MANEALFFGNMLQGYMLSRQMAEQRAARDKEIKLKTQLFEIELQKARDQQRQATTDNRLQNINRDLILGEAQLGVDTGQQKSLLDALSTVQARSDMARYGFDAEKDFGLRAPPAEVQEYEYGLQNPGFAQHQLAKRAAGGTQINLGQPGQEFGKIEQGYVYERDPATGQVVARPVPGSGADFERTGAVTQIDANYRNSTGNIDRLIEKASALANNPNLWMGVGLGAASAKMPGSPGADVQADIDSLVSQVAFGVLQAMREASKTGGALGAVSERELDLLQNNLAALSKAQSPQQYRKRLGDIVDWAQSARANLKDAYEQQRRGGQSPGLGTRPPALGAGASSEPVQITSDEEYAELPSGTVFVGPDGITRRKP